MYFIMEPEFEPKTEEKSAFNDLRSPLDCLSSALGHRRGRSKHSSKQQRQLIQLKSAAAALAALASGPDATATIAAAADLSCMRLCCWTCVTTVAYSSY